MSRLYEISYDKNVWVIKGDRAHGYNVIRKDTFDSYYFGGDIIGIEQIGECLFLVHKRILRDTWCIERYKLENSEKIQEFRIDFEDFEFLSGDLIFFDNYSIYSIKENKKIEDLHHIISKEWHDSIIYSSRNIELIYDNKEDTYPSYLLINYKLRSSHLEEYIQVMVKTSTLEPLSPIYSTLRENYIKLSNEVTLEKVFKEHNSQICVIDAFLRELYLKDNRKTENEMYDVVVGR